MNRPVPHIGRSLQQQRAMAHYLPMAEQAKRERASEEVSGLLDRVRQSGTGECADVPKVPTWADVLGIFLADMALTAAFLIGWGLVIAGTWLLAPSMTGFGEAFFRVMGGVR
jgi:hypothetical protein